MKNIKLKLTSYDLKWLVSIINYSVQEVENLKDNLLATVLYDWLKKKIIPKHIDLFTKTGKITLNLNFVHAIAIYQFLLNLPKIEHAELNLIILNITGQLDKQLINLSNDLYLLNMQKSNGHETLNASNK